MAERSSGARPSRAAGPVPSARVRADGPGDASSRPALFRDRSLWGAFLVGVAIMAGVDEIVFHQILAWHHFYDLSTTAVALVSDGILHAAELIFLVAGFFVLADARRRSSLSRQRAWAGFFCGLGLFQLWDGIIDHKVLRVHQVRYDVDLLPYDIAWNASALVLLAIGVGIALRDRRRP
jgi:uncharacterized membrane protein